MFVINSASFLTPLLLSSQISNSLFVGFQSWKPSYRRST